MSAKKSKQQPIWYNCSVCNVKLLRSNSSKHAELQCGALFPLIENNILAISLVRIPSNSALTKLPFTKSPLGDSIFFLPEYVMQECGFQSLDWILMTNDTLAAGDKDSSETPPIALQVWPIVGDTVSITSANAMVTDSCLALNAQLQLKSPHSLQPLSRKYRQLALSIMVRVDTDRPVDATKFATTFIRRFRERLVAVGNKFALPFFTDSLGITIMTVNSGNDLEMDLCERLTALHCDFNNSSVGIFTAPYYEITDQTKIDVITNAVDELPKTRPKLSSLDDVGGLSVLLEELTVFLRFVFAGKSSIPNGVLLHGNPGTGKTLMVQAICNHMNLKCVWWREHNLQDSSLQRCFSSFVTVATEEEAIRQALANQPSVILIEDLDTCTMGVNSQSRGVISVTVAQKLRNVINAVSSAKVVLIATTSKLDVLDLSLRSAQIFSKEIELPVPGQLQRLDICRKILKNFYHSLTEENTADVASATHGYVGSDLFGLFSEAAFGCAKRLGTSFEDKARPPFDTSDVKVAMKSIRPSAMKSILIDVPNVKWDDIGGQKELKLKLKQMIEWPLKHPEVFRRLGIVPPKGILMFGPPGCSKTMVAKAIATESGLNFIAVKASELFSKWVGESEKAVQRIFAKARQVSPCIIFFDEIDSLGGERGSSSGSSNVQERVLAQMLVEMDGIQPLKEVTIIAATNRPDIIDQALLRPGRLDRIMFVPLPDHNSRAEIFKIQAKKMPFGADVDIQWLADSTDGYSGAEVTAVCQEAGLFALEDDISATIVFKKHFDVALQSVRPRITKEQIQFYETYNEQRTAYK